MRRYDGGGEGLAALIGIFYFIADAVKASLMEIPCEKLTAKVWVNPDNPDDYYVRVFYQQDKEMNL